MELQHRVLLALSHIWLSPSFSPDPPLENTFDWDRRGVSFDCQPTPVPQRVGWTPHPHPAVEHPTKPEGYFISLLSSVHLLKDWQRAERPPVFFLNTTFKSKHGRQPWTLTLLQLQNSYFLGLCASEEPPELLSSSALQINRQRNATAALKGVLSEGRLGWEPQSCPLCAP